MADNIIVIILDDQSPNLLPYMAQAGVLAGQGVTFTNYFTPSPVCCTSRASMLTGWHPHNHGTISNDWPTGGYDKFFEDGMEDESIFKVLADGAGYRCNLVGKYLNHYHTLGNDGTGGATYPALHVPPGLAECWLMEDGYDQFDYSVTKKLPSGTTRIVSGETEQDYAVDRMKEVSVDFIERHVANFPASKFLLIVAPTAPHGRVKSPDPENLRFTPAPRHRALTPDRPASWGPVNFVNGDCGGAGDGGCSVVTLPDPGGNPNFNTIVTNPTAWHPTTTLANKPLANKVKDHVNRVRMMQSINEMTQAIRACLTAQGIADETWIILTDDNGFHLGEHAMRGGKGSAFDHDCRLPFIVVPPGGTTASTSTKMVSGVDMHNTFRDIAGLAQDTTRDGRSIKGFVSGTPPTPWRKTNLVAYTPDKFTWEDAQGTGVVPAHYSLRDVDRLYVDFDRSRPGPPDTERGEFYRCDVDPWQTINQYPYVVQASRDDLDELLEELSTTSGAPHWAASLTDAPTTVLGDAPVATSTNIFQLDALDFDEGPEGRYYLTSVTDYPRGPAIEAPYVWTQGIPGLTTAGKASDLESYWGCTLLVSDRLPNGAHGGEAGLDENLQDLTLMLRGSAQQVNVAYSFQGSLAFEFKARHMGEIRPQRLETRDPACLVPLLFQVAGGGRRSRDFKVWEMESPWQDENQLWIDVFPDTTLVIPDAKIRVTGPCGSFVITDRVTQSGFQWRLGSSGLDIPDGERVIVDCETRRAYKTTEDDESWNTDGLEDVSRGLTPFGPSRMLLPLTPQPVRRSARERRIVIDWQVVAGAEDRTMMEVRAKDRRP